MATLIVLDTNVLVSALLTRGGIPARVLNLVLTRQIRVAYDQRILEEYQKVLTRPHFPIEPSEAEAIIRFMENTGLLVQGRPLELSAENVPDPKDLAFAEVAIAGQVAGLITGNARHFAFLADYGILVLSPAAFLEQFQK